MMNSFQDGIIYGLRELGYDKIMDNLRRFVEALCGFEMSLWLLQLGQGRV
jgi:hypothetical protein